MGYSVADWRPTENIPETFRDRYSVSNVSSDVSTFWSTGGQPTKALYSSGSASRIVDHNHPQFRTIMELRQKHAGVRSLDYGSPLAIERVTLSMPSRIRTEVNISKTTKGYFKGVFAPTASYLNTMANISQGRFPAIPTGLGTDQLSLWALGSTAIARSIPDVPKFSLFRFIGEIREGLPKVPLKTLAEQRKFRALGGEYLNVQFGLLPTASDVQKLIEQLADPKLRAAIHHQMGEEHRVRKTIDKGVTTSSRDLTGTEMTVMPSSFSSGINGKVTLRTEYKIWSSVSFVYFQVNLLKGLLAELDDKLGGLGVVPELIDVWNLIPWSWFVDWFTNFNHVITNLSYLGRDGLVLQRGYIMATFRDVETSTQYRSFMGTPISTTGTRTFERKYRVRASPFGFGLTWKDFDPFQMSIIGALGVSRLRF